VEDIIKRGKGQTIMIAPKFGKAFVNPNSPLLVLVIGKVMRGAF